MQLHYLEIVTPDVEAICKIHAKQNDTFFGEPVELLGNARIADLAGGGRVGVRAPMHESEQPVTRPYFLVEDVEAETQKASATGAEIAHPPMEIPGLGKFSIFMLGGIQQGFWQV